MTDDRNLFSQEVSTWSFIIVITAAAVGAVVGVAAVGWLK